MDISASMPQLLICVACNFHTNTITQHIEMFVGLCQQWVRVLLVLNKSTCTESIAAECCIEQPTMGNYNSGSTLCESEMRVFVAIVLFVAFV